MLDDDPPDAEQVGDGLVDEDGLVDDALVDEDGLVDEETGEIFARVISAPI